MKKDLNVSIFQWIILAGISLGMVGCATPPTEQAQTTEPRWSKELAMLTQAVNSDSTVSDFIQMSILPDTLSFYLPAIQSPVAAHSNGVWVLFGGRKAGLHSMNNNPPAFNTLQANDSIWVVDLANQRSMGVPVPPSYFKYLAASSQQYFQDGDLLFVNGGFTFSDSSSTLVSNWTSDAFFEIDLPSLIQYVTTGGTSPALDQVFTKFLRDPYLQVTGGEMIESNGNFYIVGGHNYQGAYQPGNTGKYTNAIRKFELSMVNNAWAVTDTLTLSDPENLHRRDFNLAEVILPDEDSIGVVMMGGVFTPNDMAYQSPVYINGLASGNPSIEVDTVTKQNVNLYSSAKINSVMAAGQFRANRIALLGGITYKAYNKDSGRLVVPPITEVLPFSNLMSSYYTNGEDETIELVQMPPNELLPGYLGTNAVFFPVSDYLYGSSSNVIDLNKVFPDSVTGPVLVGYLYGGILSPAAITFSPRGPRSTTTNPILYRVFMSIPNVTQ